MNKQTLSSNKAFFFYDSYERHKKVSKLLKSLQAVLDIGGQLNALSQFKKFKKIVVANVEGSIEQSDITIKGQRLPFRDNSFDAVCAVDVLEHIKSEKREGFVKELLRVATDCIILSFPIWTEKHIKYESNLRKSLKSKAVNVSYLDEHVKFGLPSPEQIASICKGHKFELFYSGNISVNKILFTIFMFDPKIRIVRQLVYYTKLLFNMVSNPLLYLFLSNKKYSQDVNRAYLKVLKTKK